MTMKKVKLPNIPFGPFPAVLVGALADGRENYAAVGACGVVCQKPVLSVSLKSTHFTAGGVRQSGCFRVNIPGLVAEADRCGLVSGRDEDKSALFTPFYDDAARAPMIAECGINFLCRVVRTIPIYDFEMFLGEVVAVYVNESCLTDGKPDPLKIDPMILMGTGYWSLGGQVGSIYREGGKK
jgi:flavin reductase (DIM6/NTAB) family NADH-FMN oxidoreductase RutF